LLRLVRQKSLGIAGGIIVLFMLLTAIFAYFITRFSHKKIHLKDYLIPLGGT